MADGVPAEDHRYLTPAPTSVPWRRREQTAGNVLELFVHVVSLLLAVDQLLVVVPDLYWHSDVVCSKLWLRAILVSLAAVGWFGAAGTAYATMALVASVGTASTGAAQYWALGHSATATVAASLPAAIAMVGIGGSIRRLPQLRVIAGGTESLLQQLLQPFVALGLVAGLSTAAVFANAAGPVRACLAIGGGLASAAALSTAPLPHARTTFKGLAATLRRRLAYLLLATYALGAYATERRLPIGRVLSATHPIVFLSASERCMLTVTSGQGAYHFFVDDELRFSTLDDQRWAESLVRPALARVAHAERALVLSTGEGLIERELLKDPALRTITSVVRCHLVPDFARQSGWLQRLNQDAMRSTRVQVVESDPAAYLNRSDPHRYDLVIVDLPDPSGPLQSKYYSRHVYRQIAARMSPDAVLVVQATSARRSPRTFATIGATLRAAGFSIAPEMVPLISRGEWSLYLCALGHIPPVRRPEWLAGSLAATIPEQFNHPWPDTLPTGEFTAEPSTLHDAKVLDWFARESELAEPDSSRRSIDSTQDEGKGP